MSRAEPGGIDDRLRQLLDLEQRLQAMVRAAEDAANARIVQARTEAQRRRAGGEAQPSGQAEAQDAADRAAHERALQAIAADAQSVAHALSSIPDDRIDELARRALERVLASGRGTP